MKKPDRFATHDLPGFSQLANFFPLVPLPTNPGCDAAQPAAEQPQRVAFGHFARRGGGCRYRRRYTLRYTNACQCPTLVAHVATPELLTGTVTHPEMFVPLSVNFTVPSSALFELDAEDPATSTTVAVKVSDAGI